MERYFIWSLEEIFQELIFIQENNFSLTRVEIAEALNCSNRHVTFLRNLLWQINNKAVREQVQMEKYRQKQQLSYLGQKPRSLRIPEDDLQRLLVQEKKTLKQIGLQYGVSKERVRQIAEAYGIDNKRKPPEWALNADVLKIGLEKAGNLSSFSSLYGVKLSEVKYWANRYNIDYRHIAYQSVRVILRCSSCGQLFERRKKTVLRIKDQKNFFCSKICQGKCLGRFKHSTRKRSLENVVIQCSFCGKNIIKSKSKLQGKYNFCNNRCQGKWLAQRSPTLKK